MVERVYTRSMVNSYWLQTCIGVGPWQHQSKQVSAGARQRQCKATTYSSYYYTLKLLLNPRYFACWSKRSSYLSYIYTSDQQTASQRQPPNNSVHGSTHTHPDTYAGSPVVLGLSKKKSQSYTHTHSYTCIIVGTLFATSL